MSAAQVRQDVRSTEPSGRPRSQDADRMSAAQSRRDGAVEKP
ncbi:MAG: hypothetical protein ABIG42_11655 [bacterium]